MKTRMEPASATYIPTVNQSLLLQQIKFLSIQNVPQTETPTFALSDDETAQITVRN